jgi:hypothetical protein
LGHCAPSPPSPKNVFPGIVDHLYDFTTGFDGGSVSHFSFPFFSVRKTVTTSSAAAEPSRVPDLDLAWILGMFISALICGEKLRATIYPTIRVETLIQQLHTDKF